MAQSPITHTHERASPGNESLGRCNEVNGDAVQSWKHQGCQDGPTSCNDPARNSSYELPALLYHPEMCEARLTSSPLETTDRWTRSAHSLLNDQALWRGRHRFSQRPGSPHMEHVIFSKIGWRDQAERWCARCSPAAISGTSAQKRLDASPSA